MNQAPEPLRRWFAGGCCLLTAALVYFFAYNYLIAIFYQIGSGLLDAGWFSALLSGNDWRLLAPVALENAGESYYDTHISPFLLIFTYLPLPLAPAEKMSFFCALAVMLYGVVVYIAANDYLTRLIAADAVIWRYMAASLSAAALAVIIAFNGISVEILHFVHFEFWLPVFICGFLNAYVFGKRRLALLLFVLLLTVRGDAGFHFVAVIGTLLLFLHWRADKPQAEIFRLHKFLWQLTFAAFVFSLILIIFAGREVWTPAVEAGQYGRRLLGIAARPEWAVAFAVLIVWAFVAKLPLLLVGVVAALPWVLYAASVQPPLLGNLAIYYGFPLLTAFYFPFIAGRFLPPAPTKKAKKKLRISAAMSVRSLTQASR